MVHVMLLRWPRLADAGASAGRRQPPSRAVAPPRPPPAPPTHAPNAARASLAAAPLRCCRAELFCDRRAGRGRLRRADAHLWRHRRRRSAARRWRWRPMSPPARRRRGCHGRRRRRRRLIGGHGRRRPPPHCLAAARRTRAVRRCAGWGSRLASAASRTREHARAPPMRCTGRTRQMPHRARTATRSCVVPKGKAEAAAAPVAEAQGPREGRIRGGGRGGGGGQRIVNYCRARRHGRRRRWRDQIRGAPQPLSLVGEASAQFGIAHCANSRCETRVAKGTGVVKCGMTLCRRRASRASPSSPAAAAIKMLTRPQRQHVASVAAGVASGSSEPHASQVEQTEASGWAMGASRSCAKNSWWRGHRQRG